MAEALTPPPPGWDWGQLADEIFEGPPDWAAVHEHGRRGPTYVG